VSNADRRVIALGNLAGELKTSLEAAARTVGLELLLTREPARAFIELERDGALAVLVDMATLGAEQFCKRARGTERLRSVPVIGMSRHPNELGFARVFAWGADDLVPLGARLPLERRLQALRDTPRPDSTGFGQAVVAEATTQRRALVGRVLAHAGYDVKFAVDRGAVELYASQSETRLVVISAALGDPRRIIEAAARAGALPTWIVTVESRSTQRLAASLAGLDRVAVTSTAGSPEDVLFLANELVFSKGARRREWRALYATPVAFRAQGGDADEYGFSYDASPGGLYVRSLLPCTTDDVEVELRLPNRDERVRLTGKVARRFAFGSGAIASAPPGFSVKLEGPEDALARWTDACAELIAVASSTESMAPRPRTASQPVLASPGLGGKEVTLAVPPATVSIESVVAPLPVSMQAAVAEGSDVGELLAATLDEQTLAQVGTRPVTIDPDTMGVREERPSEFAMSTAALLGTDVPVQPLEPATGSPPVPIPSAKAAAAPPAEEQAPDREALGRLRTVMLEPGAGVPMPSPSRPSNDPESKPEAAADTVADVPSLGGETDPVADTVAPPPPSARSTDWDSDAKTAVRKSQPSLEDPFAPTPEAPPKPTPDKALPLAATMLSATPAPTPAFTPADATSPEALEEETRAAPPPPIRKPLAAPSIKKTLPMGFVRQQVPDSAPKAAAPTAATLRSSQPAMMPAKAKPSSRPPAGARNAGSNRALWIILALVGAAGAGMGLALISRHQDERAVRPKPTAVAQQPERVLPAPSAAPAPTAATTATPAAVETAAPGPSSEPPTAVPSAEPTATAAAVEPTPSAVEPTPTAVAAPAPSVDFTKLPAERAFLIVHSSANTQVFVHGTNYGPTNQVLTTTCGIRFVRLGRALGDFVEPGQSYVIKCGRLTELRIEPK
jgi:DNA-binding response OmpR family regulator